MHSKFKYLFDPLFLISVVVVILNKLTFPKPYWLDCTFCNYYLNDALLIPVVIPVILYLSKAIKLRDEFCPPTFLEVGIPLLIWSIAFELIGPFYFELGTSDPFDVCAYFIGGLLSWLIWNYKSLRINAQNRI